MPHLTRPRDFRPFIHYAPPGGWINDPNGLCWDGAQYHLFAQHHPDSLDWGPMHWIHAVSSDLYRWKDIGIALAPDPLGMIFSGSAVKDENGRLVCMFTHHGGTRDNPCEQQSIAYSADGARFEKFDGNPVIPNPGLPDFRDPRVLPNPFLGGWSAVIAAGDEARIYHSPDLIHWRQTGAFGKTQNQMGGVFECPDLFPLRAPDGSTIWALTVSVTQPRETGGSRAQVFLGEFDGLTFRETIPRDAPVMLDNGYDNYAQVTFSHADPPVALGWASSWTYANQLPTADYRGQMTIAKELSIVRTRFGPRIASKPVLPPLGKASPVEGKTALPGELFALDIDSDKPFEATLSNAKGEAFSFGVKNGAFYTDRARSGITGFSPYFSKPPYVRTETPRLFDPDSPIRMRLVFDRCIAELFSDGGAYTATVLVFPTIPYDAIELRGADGTLYTLNP
ncbi:MAG: glycoside hydrolase family 32 protein [Oscillospiraceae bacterium]|jgi:fructan beta-fructosidase|nr:glycoside hydrolase family 32 protein [Oscillospiraceae bacterium]